MFSYTIGNRGLYSDTSWYLAVMLFCLARIKIRANHIGIIVECIGVSERSPKFNRVSDLYQ